MSKNFKGIGLIVIVGITAFTLSKIYVLADALVLALLLGILVRLVLDQFYSCTFEFEVIYRFLIPLGFVFYGVNLKLDKLVEVAPFAWLQLIVTLCLIFGIANVVAKWLKINIQTAILTAIGTAICGASAIAMTAPVINANKESIGKSLLTITFWGLAGVAVYPIIQQYLVMSENEYALFTATTLHQTGFVKIAASYLGKSCENLALSIKILRTALIIPTLVILGIIFKSDNNSTEHGGKAVHGKYAYLSFAGFVLLGFLFSFVPAVKPYAKDISPYVALFWIFAIASVGLSIQIKSLLKEMPKMLLLGLCLWGASIAVFMFGYWVNK